MSITEKKEVFSANLLLDNKTKIRLNEKKMYRILRRKRLWHRKERFLNRKRKDKWLPPSIERRLLAHIKFIEKIKQFLPVF
jgi:hypothetical protein